jgi:hypothetical protein
VVGVVLTWLRGRGRRSVGVVRRRTWDVAVDVKAMCARIEVDRRAVERGMLGQSVTRDAQARGAHLGVHQVVVG